MLLLKANLKLKAVFMKLINTMGKDVKWTEVFAITNNDLILAGKDRVLLFNFGNKKIGTNLVELPFKEEMIEQIIENELLENILNMTLYVFGKWGGIKGLTVEKDYSQLNALFGNLLAEINVEPVLTEDNLRFYKDGIQITYEEVVQIILDKQKAENEVVSEKSEDNNSDSNEDEINKYNIGLWHKMVWTGGNFSFEKEKLSESDKAKLHIAYNFYMVTYKCPVCKEKLYMVVYSSGKELLIETDEKGVYLSRAYTCCTCHSFYTPKPHLLLMEGDVYNIEFGDDNEAYEDYLDLLGKQGEKTSNCNFNEYETDYNNKNQENPEQLEEIFNDIDSMSDEEIYELMDKMDSGFYPQKKSEKYYSEIDKELKRRQHQQKEKNTGFERDIDEDTDIDSDIDRDKDKDSDKDKDRNRDSKSDKDRDKVRDKDKVIKNDIDIKRDLKKDIEKDKDNEKIQTPASGFNTALKQEMNFTSNKSEHEYNIKRESSTNTESSIKIETPQQTLKEEVASLQKEILTVLTSKQLEDLKLQLQSELGLDKIDKNDKDDCINKIDLVIYKEKEIIRKAVSCKEKDYSKIVLAIDEIKSETSSDSIKKSILNSLKEMLERRGIKELDTIISQIPLNVSKKQHKLFKEKIEQYKEIDNSTHMKGLDIKRDEVEKQEIANLIKRFNAKDRDSLFDVYNKLQKEDFEVRNTTPYLEKIHAKIYAIDDAAIKKICPDPADISFEEGLQAFKEISSGNLLPELKTDILGMIDKRLTKLKMSECEHLVNKISKDMGRIVTENSRIYLYDVRKMMRENADEDSIIINNALNTYAASRGKYEFPILICDTSLKANGAKGFVLTPDHIFYNSVMSAGVINVNNIESITIHKNILSTAIYAKKINSEKVKISNSHKLEELKPFSNVLNDFVCYLKEKPESRDISYMAKENHIVKCCYRCGYVYKEGNTCPKCGSRFNG